MLMQYIQAAMRHAKYGILFDDGSCYGETPLCQGVYANAASLEECREQLEEVLEEWILLRVHKHLSLPVIDSVDLAVEKTA